MGDPNVHRVLEVRTPKMGSPLEGDPNVCRVLEMRTPKMGSPLEGDPNVHRVLEVRAPHWVPHRRMTQMCTGCWR